MTDVPTPWPGWRSVAWAGAVYLAIALAMTWPLAQAPASSIPVDVGDPILNTWILWWGATHVPLSTAWWNAPAFFPATGVTAFSEHLLGLQPIAAPVIHLTGSPLAAYNATFLSTFVLSALSAFILTSSITGRRDAGFLAGLAFGFSPYRIAQWSHLQVLASFWIPVALLALHRHVLQPRVVWLALLALAIVMQALSNAYYLVFLPVLIGLWCLWFIRPSQWRLGGSIAMALIAAFAPLSPLLLGYQDVHDRYGLTRNLDQMRMYSADPLSIVTSSGHLAMWSSLVPARNGETALFPGFAVLGLCAVGAIVLLTRRDGAGSREPLAARRVLAFYLLSALVLYVLALGPSLSLTGGDVRIWGPYRLVAELPGFSSLRAPARFGMLVMCCLAVAGSIAFAWITRGVSARWRWSAALLIGAVMLADTWPSAMPIHEPPRASALSSSDLAGPVLVVPVLNELNEAAAMYRAMSHGQPVANGYSGHIPPWYLTMREALNDEQPLALEALSRAGVRYISVVKRQDRDGGWRRFVSTRARLVRDVDDTALYELAPPPAPVRAEGGIPVAAIRASHHPEAASNLLDGRLDTAWYTDGPQRGGEWLELDLDAVHAVSGLELRLADAFHFPRLLEIEVKSSRGEWIMAWSGRTSALALDASLQRGSRDAAMVIDVGNAVASAIRLRQTGHHAHAPWSMIEIRVLPRR